MGTEIIEIPPQSKAVDLTRKDMVGSRLWPSINTPEKAAVVIARSQSYGLCPTVVADGFYFVGGKPAMSAQLIATLVKRSDKYNFRVRKKTDKSCQIEFFERDNGKWESLGVEEFTMEMAQRAKLASGVNWQKFPEAMLWARCLTAGVRARCPDALGGGPVYCVEELSPHSEVDAEGRIVIDAEVVEKRQDLPPANDKDLVSEIEALIVQVGADWEKVVKYLDCPLEAASKDQLEKVKKTLQARLK